MDVDEIAAKTRPEFSCDSYDKEIESSRKWTIFRDVPTPPNSSVGQLARYHQNGRNTSIESYD